MADTTKTERWIKCLDPETNAHFPLKVEAFVVPGIPGLFVNRYVERIINRRTGKKKTSKKLWTITHRKSGLRFPVDEKFNGKEEAINVMVAIGHLVDWDVQMENLPLGYDLKNIVERAIEEVRNQ